MFADWTDRIAAGELPPLAPPRPQGLERSLVLTEWDWADPTGYLHDEVSTDRRNPTVNGNGLIYGSMEHSTDYLPVLDPVHNTTSRVQLTIADPDTPPAALQSELAPSPYFGDQLTWTGRANVHNAMLDSAGRVWFTTTVRPPQAPDYCGRTRPFRQPSVPDCHVGPAARDVRPANREANDDEQSNPLPAPARPTGRLTRARAR